MQSKTRISLLILLVIGLHAVPVLFYQGERQTRWPFLSWTMYAKSFPPGPITMAMRRLVATSASGREEEVTPELLGMPMPAFRNAFVTPLRQGDSSPAYVLVQRLNQGRSDPVVRLRLEGLRLTLVDTGVVKDSVPVLTYQVHPSGSR
jgi:hypothetical protein